MSPQLQLIAWLLMPLWLAAGFADWLCHRATAIERTTGAKESLIHLLMFVQVGVPVLGALLFEVDALVLLVMIVGFALHEITALWDVRYAEQARNVTPFEQHVHSYLEMIPLMAILLFASASWPQFTALLGFGDEPARFALVWRPAPLPIAYYAALAAGIVVFAIAPYLEELLRGLRANGGALVPPPAGNRSA
jgi:hypothetical protein